ncbi:hypothetical protein QJS10_CPB18g01090 [Acorus calamus]|uniref:Uncharacterized protein n=1 Tax=Acorus calamus TaxID=4465 RepID=A0AAV9CN74_ACOCL|nr:hypothetical protein QJS10_CPB18g01090 [Acorus calamus]
MNSNSCNGESSGLGSSSSSGGRSGSTKNRKNNYSGKPRQPQRGLGVAQLEQIRLHNQLGCGGGGFLPSLNSSLHFSLNKMNFVDIQRQEIRLGEYHSIYTSRWNQIDTTISEPRPIENNHHVHLGASPSNPFKDSMYKKRRKDLFSDSKGWSNKNCNPSDLQELDLDLKLSL